MKAVAILGFGVVGRGTAELIRDNAAVISATVGEDVILKYALDRYEITDPAFRSCYVSDIATIVADPEVSVVAEAIGGLHPAYEFTRECLAAGKSVVTSNKELVSTYGAELLSLAAENGVYYLFEASTGGAIPVLAPLVRDLSCNRVTGISGILNGTTNYILSRMYRAGVSFEDALREAQERGYAERNPAADVEGIDTCRKICILTATVTGVLIPPDRVPTEGITAIRSRDVALAEKNGYAVRLLGRYETRGDDTFVNVAPCFVPVSNPLSHIDDVFNGVNVTCNYAGEILFSGRGAGSHPTASSVVADIVSIFAGTARRMIWRTADDNFPTDPALFAGRHYVSLIGAERSAVSVVFENAEFLPTDDGELSFFTPEITEREMEDGLRRLLSTGIAVAAHLRVAS